MNIKTEMVIVLDFLKFFSNEKKISIYYIRGRMNKKMKSFLPIN